MYFSSSAIISAVRRPLRLFHHTAIVPSCDAQNPHDITCSTDAEATCKQILYSIEEADRKDVILVCYSDGGIPGGVFAYDLGKIKRTKDCREDGVIGLIYWL